MSEQEGLRTYARKNGAKVFVKTTIKSSAGIKNSANTAVPKIKKKIQLSEDDMDAIEWLKTVNGENSGNDVNVAISNNNDNLLIKSSANTAVPKIKKKLHISEDHMDASEWLKTVTGENSGNDVNVAISNNNDNLSTPTLVMNESEWLDPMDDFDKMRLDIGTIPEKKKSSAVERPKFMYHNLMPKTHLMESTPLRSCTQSLECPKIHHSFNLSPISFNKGAETINFSEHIVSPQLDPATPTPYDNLVSGGSINVQEVNAVNLVSFQPVITLRRCAFNNNREFNSKSDSKVKSSCSSKEPLLSFSNVIEQCDESDKENNVEEFKPLIVKSPDDEKVVSVNHEPSVVMIESEDSANTSNDTQLKIKVLEDDKGHVNVIIVKRKQNIKDVQIKTVLSTKNETQTKPYGHDLKVPTQTISSIRGSCIPCPLTENRRSSFTQTVNIKQRDSSTQTDSNNAQTNNVEAADMPITKKGGKRKQHSELVRNHPNVNYRARTRLQTKKKNEALLIKKCSVVLEPISTVILSAQVPDSFINPYEDTPMLIKKITRKTVKFDTTEQIDITRRSCIGAKESIPNELRNNNIELVPDKTQQKTDPNNSPSSNKLISSDTCRNAETSLFKKPLLNNNQVQRQSSRITLFAGKKYRRSLSIYNQVRRFSMHVKGNTEVSLANGLEFAQSRGRSIREKWRQSVAAICEAQQNVDTSLANEVFNESHALGLAKLSINDCHQYTPELRSIYKKQTSTDDSKEADASVSITDVTERGSDSPVVLDSTQLGRTLEGIYNSELESRAVVLTHCRQTDAVPFSQIYPNRSLKKCHKIGEGLYGEVFLYKDIDTGECAVLKIIPIEGNLHVNGEPQKKFREIISEIVIATEVSNLRTGLSNVTSNFCQVKRISCVQGYYPRILLDLWDEFDEQKQSENDRPSVFDEDQLYIVFELASAGSDLEAFEFLHAGEALSVFMQTALALSVAEHAVSFEHRDLHWGNVLIQPTDEKEIEFVIDGQSEFVKTHGVRATIIDFTLSRISLDKVVVFNDLHSDEDLFIGTGDYQFDIYRLMQKVNGNNWQEFCPHTNILWLHYICDKMICGARYKKPKSKIHKEHLKLLKIIKESILHFETIDNFLEEYEKLETNQVNILSTI